jgi:hypothetical protein
MPLGAPGETYEVPQDPEERKRYLMRSGEITTREHNKQRISSPEIDRQRREELDARASQLAERSKNAEDSPTSTHE